MTGFSLNGKSLSSWISCLRLQNCSLNCPACEISFSTLFPCHPHQSLNPFHSIPFIGYINLSSVTQCPDLDLNYHFLSLQTGHTAFTSAPSQSILRIGSDHFKCKCNFFSVLPSPKDWNQICQHDVQNL